MCQHVCTGRICKQRSSNALILAQTSDDRRAGAEASGRQAPPAKVLPPAAGPASGGAPAKLAPTELEDSDIFQQPAKPASKPAAAAAAKPKAPAGSMRDALPQLRKVCAPCCVARAARARARCFLRNLASGSERRACNELAGLVQSSQASRMRLTCATISSCFNPEDSLALQFLGWLYHPLLWFRGFEQHLNESVQALRPQSHCVMMPVWLRPCPSRF